MNADPISRIEQVKGFFKILFCRHKNTETRTIKGGSEGKEMQVIAKYELCKRCGGHRYE